MKKFAFGALLLTSSFQLFAQLAPTKLPNMPAPTILKDGQLYVDGDSVVQATAPTTNSSTQSSGSTTQSTGSTVSSENNVYSEYEKSVQNGKTIATLGPNLFGDQVDLNHGGLSFFFFFVLLPGNNALPVAFTRAHSVRNVKGYIVYDFAMADWQLDIPNISFESMWEWQDQRCSVSSAASLVPPTIQTTTYDNNPDSFTYGLRTFNFIRASQYWHGFHAQMPGGGEMLLVNHTAAKPTQGGPYYWSTNNQTFFSCTPSIKNGTGEGFVAVTSDGTKYWFDWRAQTFQPNLELSQYYAYRRARMAMYVTRVEDRHGNWVTYTYTNNAYSPVKLTQITSNDGRSLAISYAFNGFREYVSTVSDGTRTWRYDYEYFATTKPLLKKVTLPDNSAWEFAFTGLSDARIDYWYKTDTREESHTCETPGDAVIRAFGGTIKHPSGAIGEYAVVPTRFGRSNVTNNCQTNTFFFPSMPKWLNPKNFQQNSDAVRYDALSLIRKRVSGPGIETTTSDYSYSGSSVGFAPSYPICQADSCAGSNVTSVNNSNGTWEKFTFGNSYYYNEGKLLRSEKGRGAITQSAEVNTYELAKQGLPFPTPFAASPQRGQVSTFASEYIRPVKTTTIVQDGVSFNSAVNGFDSFARPISVTKSSALASSKTDTIVYRDDINKWVLGQVSSVSTGITGDATTTKEVGRTEYDANSSLPLQTFSFGALQSTMSYNPNGTVASIKDANNNVTSLSNYKRGMPQRVDYPDGSFETAIVNDLGWVTSNTDARGNTTGYEYNLLGRLTKVLPPAGDTVAWNATSLSFDQLATAAYGLPVGAWKQMISVGNSRVETYFDAMWRPVVKREYDNTNILGTQRFTRMAYDNESRVIFASYPGKGDLITQGTRTQYDDLGRITSTKQDSEIGELITTFEYLPGFQTRTTNPRGKSTTVAYQVFDKPERSAPILIQSPEFQKTTINRDVFGKPTNIVKMSTETIDCLGGGSCPQPKVVYSRKHYVYDEHQRLCKRVEPETNATIIDYDAAGNMLWSAQGSLLTDINSCNRANIATTDKNIRTYDALNRLKTVDVPNSASDLSYSYLPGGLLSSLSNGGVVWNYNYNKINLPVAEILSLDSRTKTISHRYNANGIEDLLTLPSGLTIPYSPNALAQATQAGSFATNATYRSNGTMSGFSYGNTAVHSQLPNLRGLPAKRTDSFGSTVLQDERLAFDANGNVRCIRDNTAGNGGHRDMYYDGMDRLSDASAPNQWWISARYQYDALDNLTFQRLGNRHFTYQYDSQQRLEKINQPVNTTPVAPGILTACIENALSEDIGTLSPVGTTPGGGGTPPGGGGGPPGGGGDPGGGEQQQAAVASRTSVARTTSTVTAATATSVASVAATPTTEPFTTLYQFGYDANGNTISGRQDMVYDGLNRVTQVTGKESYVYDGHGRRVKTTRLSDNKVNYSVYGLNGQLITEDDARSNKKTDYVYLNGRLVAQRSAALTGTTAQTTTYINTYLHTDSLGSPVAYSNQAGAITKIERYTPYGEPSDQTYDQGPGYTGHVTDSLTGLSYAQQRYYDPMLGRFLSADPVETDPDTGASFNRFTYANNNPYKYVDPDGNENVLIFKTEKEQKKKNDPWGRAAKNAEVRAQQIYGKRYAELNISILDVTNVDDVNKALTNTKDIVSVVFIGHSNSKALFIGADAVPGSNISAISGDNNVSPSLLNWSNLTTAASISILGCHAGNGSDSIAQSIANASGKPTAAADTFLNFNEESGQPFFKWWRFGDFNVFRPGGN